MGFWPKLCQAITFITFSNTFSHPTPEMLTEPCKSYGSPHPKPPRSQSVPALALPGWSVALSTKKKCRFLIGESHRGVSQSQHWLCLAALRRSPIRKGVVFLLGRATEEPVHIRLFWFFGPGCSRNWGKPYPHSALSLILIRLCIWLYIYINMSTYY